MQKGRIEKPAHVWNEFYERHRRGESVKSLALEYGVREGTAASRMWRMKKNRRESYTLPAHLTVGDKAVVVESPIAKQVGKLITINHIGPTFIEGVDGKGNNIAANKVLRKAELVIKPKDEAPTPEVEVAAEVTTPTPAVENDEIIWERKLIYDVQTATHLYKVKVEANQIQIFDGDDNTITINKGRVDDISLILRKLPEIINEEK